MSTTGNSPPAEKKPHRVRNRTLIACVAVLALLVIARALLPIWVKDYAEDRLNRIDGYRTTIEDVDLALWRGAYVIEGLRTVRTDGEIGVPFFTAPSIGLSMQWSQLWNGHLVGEMTLREPALNFVGAPEGEARQTSIEASWTDRVEELFPFRFNRVTVERGEVHFRNFHVDPQIDLYLAELDAVAKNLTNSLDLSKSLVASIDGDAIAQGEAPLRFETQLDPYAERPTFALEVELSKLSLVKLNDVLRAYLGADAEAGTFAVYLEVLADDGTFEGYVKPILEDVDILDWDEEEGGFFRKVWEALVHAGAKIFQNPSKDRVATRLPLSGTVEDPDVGIWATIAGLVRNAFIQALTHGLDDYTPKKLRHLGDALTGDAPSDA